MYIYLSYCQRFSNRVPSSANLSNKKPQLSNNGRDGHLKFCIEQQALHHQLGYFSHSARDALPYNALKNSSSELKTIGALVIVHY